MKTEVVVVLPYDPSWKTDFENIKAEIQQSIGDLVIGIEHVGSAPVEGLSAKPIINISKDRRRCQVIGTDVYLFISSPPSSWPFSADPLSF